jgi:hypothetical protein
VAVTTEVARTTIGADTTRDTAGVNGVVGGRGSGAVGSADARVVLAAAPRQTDAGVANRVALHLVDGHLSGVAVDKLDEAAALARGDLHVGDLSESLEE